MDLQKLNPWNWFKHEEPAKEQEAVIPVKREDYAHIPREMTPFNDLHREIDRLFDNAFRNFGFPSYPRLPLEDRTLSSWSPPTFQASLNVASDDQKYSITLEAPGLERDDISIDLRDNDLIIKGNKQEEIEDKEKQYYRIERRYGVFERILSVPEDGDVDKIEASMKSGVLSIQIPRKETSHSEVKKITIAEG